MIRHSIDRPLALTMAYGAAAAVGVASALSLPVELLPDPRYPRITVGTRWPLTAPEIVEARLTAPLEAGIQQLRGVTNTSSVSGAGFSQIRVEFDREIDMGLARHRLRELVHSLRRALPAGVRPVIEYYVPEEFRTGERADLRYTLVGSQTDDRLRAYAESELGPGLEAVDGVAAVEVVGGADRVVRVELDGERMALHGVTTAAVLEVLGSADLTRAAGKLRRGATGWLVTVRGATVGEGEVGTMAVRSDPATGRLVRISDVARIGTGPSGPAESYRIDGRPAVSLWVFRRPGRNALRVARAVEARATELRAGIPPGMRLMLAHDGTRAIDRQLAAFRFRAALATAVIFVVLLGFLASFRSAVIVIGTAALSILLTVSLIHHSRGSLNSLTLAALAMGFGIAIDNAIVVLENIHRRWLSGEPPSAATESGAREVALPVVAATLTTVIALGPFLYLQGELRLYYVPFACAVALTLVASLVVAFTFVPATAARALDRAARPTSGHTPGLGPYRRLLAIVLAHPLLTVGLFAVGLYASYRIFERDVVRGTVWGRAWAEDTYIGIHIRMPRGAEFERTDGLARHFESTLAALPIVQGYSARVGSEFASIRVTLPDSVARSAVAVALKERLVAYSHRFGGADIRVYGFGPSFYNRGASAPSYRLRILGYEYDRVRDIAETLAHRLARSGRAREIDANASRWWGGARAWEYVMTPDRRRLEAYGVTVQQAFDHVTPGVPVDLGGPVRSAATGGATRYRIEPPGHRGFSLSEWRELRVPTARGGRARLADLVSLDLRRAPDRIIRASQQYERWVTWSFNGPRALGDRVRDRLVATTALPAGYRIEKEPGLLWTEHGRRRTYAVIALALVLVYMVTAALFESVRAPLLVLATVPSGLIGVFIVFVLTGATFTRSAHVGLLMMTGLVVNGAILVVHRMDALRQSGLELRAAVVQGTLDRTRPVLMTASTTVIGLLPLVLFARAPDASVWNALVLTTVGGLVSSTVFVLTALPALYYRLERRRVAAGSPPCGRSRSVCSLSSRASERERLVSRRVVLGRCLSAPLPRGQLRGSGDGGRPNRRANRT